MPRQRIAPGTVGPVAVVPLGVADNAAEAVIPLPTADDGRPLTYPKNLKVGDSLKVERDWTITEYVVTRWRGLARAVDTDGSTHMVRRWSPTKAAAEASTRQAGLDKLASLAAARQAAKDAAVVAAEGDVSTTVADLVRRVMTGHDVAKLAVRTRQNYGYTTALIFDHAVGRMLPRNVDVSVVKAFLLAVATQHGFSTANRCRAILSKALDLAVESRALSVPFNPVLAIRNAIPKVSVQDRGLDHSRVLTDGQVTELLTALRADPLALPMVGPRTKSKHGQAGTATPNGQDLADLLAFTFATGCRIGEATALRWSDLTLTGSAPIADITGTMTFVNGVGAVRQAKTKTKAGDRPVPLSGDLVELLTARADLFGIDLDNAADLALPVFPSPQHHDRWRDPSNLSKTLRAAFTRHGHDWASSHLARRYRVTSLLDRGVPVGKVADMVGHTKITTTMAYVGRGRGTDDQVRAAL